MNRIDTEWDFQATVFVHLWSVFMQWRYVRIAAFAWVILGYSRGWSIAAAPFGHLIAVLTGCLTFAALMDAILTGWSILKPHPKAPTRGDDK